MTAPQLDFIRSLVSERDLDATPDDARAVYVQQLVAGTAREPSAAQASSIIEWLLGLPRKREVEQALLARASQFPDVPEGRYAVELGGVLRFFNVDRPTEGRWAGRQFLSEVIGGESRGRSIREAGEKSLVLQALAQDSDAARALYGREIGRCGCCNRTLTDETSRKSGIGPDCAQQHGIDRQAIIDALETDGMFVVEGAAVAELTEDGDVTLTPESSDAAWQRLVKAGF